MCYKIIKEPNNYDIIHIFLNPLQEKLRKDYQMNNSINYNFSNCNIVLNTISDITHFEGQNNDDNIMFIKGGIVTDEGIMVAQAGDVVSCKIVKQLVALFPQVANATTIMTISSPQHTSPIGRV